MQNSYLDAIRKFEGFTPKAQWDYAQHTNGYGTKAAHPGEVIDKAEADRRFQAEIANASAIVERHAPNVDAGTKAALTSLTFNAGDKWARSGLGDAIRSGDLDGARELFLQYNKAGGEVLPGLVSRRVAEAAWIGGSGSQMASATDLPTTSSDVAAVAAAFDPIAVDSRTTPLAEAEPLLASSETPASEGEGEDAATLIRAAVASLGGEAKLTQLLLAAQFIGAQSAEDDKGKTARSDGPLTT